MKKLYNFKIQIHFLKYIYIYIYICFVNVEIDPSRLWNSFFVHLKTSLKKEVEDRQEERSTTQAIEIVCLEEIKVEESIGCNMGSIQASSLTNHPQQGSPPKHSYMVLNCPCKAHCGSMFEGGPMKGFPRNQQNQYI
jgi:hypothetical protein